MDDDRRLVDIEEGRRRKPERDLQLSQLGGRAYPGQPDDIQDLGENEIAEAEFLAQLGTPSFDAVRLRGRRHAGSLRRRLAPRNRVGSAVVA